MSCAVVHNISRAFCVMLFCAMLARFLSLGAWDTSLVRVTWVLNIRRLRFPPSRTFRPFVRPSVGRTDAPSRAGTSIPYTMY